MTYFCYRCGCKGFGSISLEEFSRGVQSFGVEKLNLIIPKIIGIKEELLDCSTNDFKNFYYFLFDYNFDKKNPKKQLEYDLVELYFNQLFANQFKIVSKFLDFLKNVKKEGLKQDPWNVFLEFLLKIGDAFPKGYSTKYAWPSVIDEFYMHYCEQNGIDINQEDEEEF